MRTRHTARGAVVLSGASGAPTDQRLEDGQLSDHYVMAPEELAAGARAEVRYTYTHVGRPARGWSGLEPLSPDEVEEHAEDGWVAYERYPAGSGPSGRYWTLEGIDGTRGCGASTRVPEAVAQTYAANPGYYGSTFCCGCGQYRPVGAEGEFVWDGTDVRVGT